ncbi:MAG: hypothetical protein M3438_10705 [Pseudomonadota bacterium]|nr:hypothetical protein [Sphingomonas sp.]MDQ3479602.1 hypothetical protein [Pseudomonadota bacterium]
MNDINRLDGRSGLTWARPVAWAGAVALVLLPLAAMQFAPNSGVNWTASDFVFAALVIGGVGLAFEVAVRISTNWSYRAGAAVGLAAGFLLVWSNAAVGYIGDDNSYNMIFFAIVALALLGAIIARFRARGMAIVMVATGIAHAIAGGIGYPQDPVTGPFTLVFTAMWLTSAWLFHQASRQGATR